MAHFTNPTNKLEACPFDPTHRVKSSRLQMHITKCRLNFLDNDKEVCPFNAQHRFDRGTLGNHILSCPDRAPIDQSLVAPRDNFFKGHTGVPPYNSVEVPAGESWDAEIEPSPSAGYVPRVIPPNRGIRTDFGQMKPAERKQYYKQLYTSGADEEDMTSSSSESPVILTELKSPKTHSEAEIIVKELAKLQNIGLGRGQTPTPHHHRIAANIFGSSSPFPPMRQPQTFSYADAVHAGIGIGRGHQADISCTTRIPNGHGRGKLPGT